MAPSTRMRTHADRVGTALVSLALVVACSDDAGTRPLSGVLITLDTTVQTALGAYGQALDATPHLDALAAQSVLYEQARTVAPLTLPAHTSMLTGLYPLRHGVRDNGLMPLSQAADTLAERARAAGFDTAAFLSAVVLAEPFGLNQGFDHYEVPTGKAEGPAAHILERSAEEVTRAAQDWLRGRTSGRPFFLWVHYFDPHEPYAPDVLAASAELNPYLIEVARMDRSIGELLATIEQEEGLERTLVIAVADHGESFGEHGERTHSVLCYELPLRVPFLVRYPDGWGAGTRSREIVSVVDVFPTFVDGLGLGRPVDIDGESLFRRSVPEDRGVYFESLTGYLNYGWSPITGWVDAQGKYLHGTTPEFFDVASDITEERDRIDRTDVGSYVRALETLGERSILESSGAAGSAEGNAGIDEALRDQIQALGYAGAASGDVQWPAPTADTGLPDPRTRMDELESFYAAILAYNKGEKDEGIRDLREIVRKNPLNVSALHILSTYLFQAGETEEALATLDSIPAAGRDRSVVHDIYGHCYEKRGDATRAEEHYRRALELRPGDEHQLEDLARVLGVIEGQRE